MKKIILSLIIGLGLILSSCSDKFLDQYPQGSMIMESQYLQLDNVLAGTMTGVYSLLYQSSGSGQDYYGQRSIDLFTDICSGDVALTNHAYGWYYTDEQQQTRGRTSYFWGYFYDIIHNTNNVMAMARKQSEVFDAIAKYGLPTNDLAVVVGTDTVYRYTEEDAKVAVIYAQCLTMRGYCYSNLARYYCPTPEELINGTNKTYPQVTLMADKKCVPIYTELDMDSARARSSLKEVYDRIEMDLTDAIDYFKAFQKYSPRQNKLEVDINVARGLLAYAYLSKGAPSNTNKEPYQKALTVANDLIIESPYTIIPKEDLYSTGFNSVSSNSWIWGSQTTVENYTGLASFWGHVDIHCYSYAWIGDTKACDENLYNSIPSWDGRKGWFNDGKTGNPTFRLTPDKKFFSSKNPTSTDQDDLDREWLNDNVYMRIELAYLIAAEAAYRLGDYATSIVYLARLTADRVDINSLTADAEYAAWLTTLSDPNELLKAIYYNWRIELWGEGYAMQTMRRLNPEIQALMLENDKIKRGGNHCAKGGEQIDAHEIWYTFQLPSSESRYNPWIDTKTVSLE